MPRRGSAWWAKPCPESATGHHEERDPTGARRCRWCKATMPDDLPRLVRAQLAELAEDQRTAEENALPDDSAYRYYYDPDFGSDGNDCYER